MSVRNPNEMDAMRVTHEVPLDRVPPGGVGTSSCEDDVSDFKA